MNRSTPRLLTLVACLAGASGSAWADPAHSGAMSKPAAAKLKEGLRLYGVGDFGAAAYTLHQAYELDHHRDILFAWAQALRRAGDCEGATARFEEFIATAPPAAQVDAATKGIAICKDTAAPAKPVEPTATTTVAPRPITPRPSTKPAVRPRALAPPPTRAASPSVTLAAAPSPAEHEGRGLRVVGYAAAGVGLVALGLGVKYGLDARDASSRLDALAPPDAYDARLAAAGASAERRQILYSSVGAALTIAGGVCWYLGFRAGQPHELMVVPTAGGAAVVLGGAL